MVRESRRGNSVHGKITTSLSVMLNGQCIMNAILADVF